MKPNSRFTKLGPLRPCLERHSVRSADCLRLWVHMTCIMLHFLLKKGQEELNGPVLNPVSLSDCLFIYLIHMLLLCVCISPLRRQRGFLQHDSGSAGLWSCLSHVPSIAMATVNCKTGWHTHTRKTYSPSLPPSLLSPHTFTQTSSSRRMQQEYRRTCLSWREITQHRGNTWQRGRGRRRDRHTGMLETHFTITCCIVHSQEWAEVSSSREKKIFVYSA